MPTPTIQPVSYARVAETITAFQVVQDPFDYYNVLLTQGWAGIYPTFENSFFIHYLNMRSPSGDPVRFKQGDWIIMYAGGGARVVEDGLFQKLYVPIGAPDA